ncbi:hypothetical protein Tco_0262068 [Tanacetum coccineum]
MDVVDVGSLLELIVVGESALVLGVDGGSVLEEGDELELVFDGGLVLGVGDEFSEEECSWTGKGVFGISRDDGCVLETGD